MYAAPSVWNNLQLNFNVYLTLTINLLKTENSTKYLSQFSLAHGETMICDSKNTV